MVNVRTIIITQMVTGGISVISSIAIIVLILRSMTRLSETFHRIMVGLSLADIFLSLALSFGTIPSPRGAYAAEFARGNISTCNAQGFFNIFGNASAPLYAITLQFYFLLRIKYNMPIEKLVKNVEPFLHAAPIVYGLIAAIVSLSLGSINATAWTSCFITSFPYGCSDTVAYELKLNKGEDCTRGTKARYLKWGLFGIPYIIIFISMCVTLWMMYSAMRELEVRRKKHMFLPEDPILRASVLQESRIHERSQKLLKRAFSYLAAFALSFMNAWVLTIITSRGHYNSVYTLVALLFHPLHGLYNLIVFLWPKVMRLRGENEGLSLLQKIIVAIRTYDRTVPSDNNFDSNTRNRGSVIDWLGRSLRIRSLRKSFGLNLSSRKIERSLKLTQKTPDTPFVNECQMNRLNMSCQPVTNSDRLSENERNGLHTACQSLRDSDVISFSESEKNDLSRSCESLRDNDGLSVSESESESEKSTLRQSFKPMLDKFERK